MSTGDADLVGVDETASADEAHDRARSSPTLDHCRFSSPAAIMMDDEDPLTRARRSTLVRVFGVPDGLPNAALPDPEPSVERIKSGGHEASLARGSLAPPLVCARDHEMGSPRATWHAPSVRTHEENGGPPLPHDAENPHVHPDLDALVDPDETLRPPIRRPIGKSPDDRQRRAAALNALNRSVSDQTRSRPHILSDDVVTMHDQVRLLMINLEEEKKRRASEQKLMQQKILELQRFIRHHFPEQQKALERRVQCLGATVPVPGPRGSHSTRPNRRVGVATSPTGALTPTLSPRDHESVLSDLASPPARRSPTSASSEFARTPSDDVAYQQAVRLRAKMPSTVAEAQQQVRILKLQLVQERRSFEQRERHLRSEASVHLATVEAKHLRIEGDLTHHVQMLTTQLATLQTAKTRLEHDVVAKDARIRNLELALEGKAVVSDAATNGQQSP